MKTLLALAISAFVLHAPAPVREYRIDTSHTDVTFSIGFLGHPVRGRFDDVRGTIVYAPGNPAASAVTVVIATKSIATGSAHRDEHLRSADFFDAAKYPAIVFRSASIVQRKDSFLAAGPLTMHGITRRVTIAFRETQPPLADPHGSNLVFFSGRLRIARRDFDILGGSKFNDWFDELRSATMGDSVDIALDVAGWEPDPQRTKRYDAAIQRIESSGVAATVARIVATPPDSARASAYDIEQLARGLQARGKHAEAVAIMTALNDKVPGDAALHAALARIHELAGDEPAAKSRTSRALGINPLEHRALELARRLGIEQVPSGAPRS